MTAHSAQADCAACVTACPHGALALAGAGLTLEAACCTGCGHCAAACPEAALSLPANAAMQSSPESTLAVLACAHADGTAHRPMAAPAPAPRCAQALGLNDLAALWLSGVRVLALGTGDCATCPDAPPAGHGLRDRLELLNRLLHSRALPALAAAQAPPAVLHRHFAAAARPAKGAQNPARRAFLGALTRPITAAPPSQTALARLQALPASTGGTPLFAHVPRIDAARCTGCDACVKICPHGALILVKDAGERLCYRVDPAACTGCGICTDICDTGAIALDEPGEAPSELTLFPFTCRICRADMHPPQPEAAATGLCSGCASGRWGRTPVLVLT